MKKTGFCTLEEKTVLTTEETENAEKYNFEILSNFSPGIFILTTLNISV